MNLQAKYFGILHTSKKTPYTDGKTLLFSNLNSSFTANSFEDVSKKLAGNGFHLGYFSYDLKNSIEKLPHDEDFFIKTPEAWFGNFKDIETRAEYKLPTQPYSVPKIKYLKSNMTKVEYLSKVSKIKEYIEQGDIYQANLTRKFYGEFEGDVDAYSIFCELNKVSPAPYSAYLKLDDTHIISSSPELFIRIESNGNAVTCPIKGSSKAGEGAELSISEKDKSENLMITDLMRNDFSRSCIAGSVKVKNLFEVSEFKNISHMYSTITGKIDASDKTKPIELLKNCFPPGSMTGAPKVHAMEIISDLEKHKRGIYSGALGYFNFNKDAATLAEFSVVIRTIIIQGNKFEFQVGGGIIYDSVPEKEWAETMLKAQAIAGVLGVNKLVNLL